MSVSPTASANIPRRLELALFLLFLAAVLLTHASKEQTHLLAWGAPPLPAPLSDTGWRFGILGMLPVFLLLLNLLSIGRTKHSLRSIPWPLALTLGALTLLALAGLRSSPAWVLLVPLGLCWFVFLYTLRTGLPTGAVPPAMHPTVAGTLAAVVIIQAAVGLAQTILQSEVGLTFLGEPVLDLTVEGTSVVLLRGENWLRAYGLNSHPNQFGMKVAVLMLMLLPALASSRRWLRIGVSLALAAGAIGLLLSFSRSAILGLLLGLGVYPLLLRKANLSKSSVATRNRWLLAGALLAGLAFLTTALGGAWAGRFFDLGNVLESRSLLERARDLEIAAQLLAEYPLRGAGLGQYQAAASQLDPDALVVHNVPLLLGAELGAPGLAAWLLFCFSPLWVYWQHCRAGNGNPVQFAPAAAVWLAMIAISFVQQEPHVFNIQGAALWGLACALWANVEMSQNAEVPVGATVGRSASGSGLRVLQKDPKPNHHPEQ